MAVSGACRSDVYQDCLCMRHGVGMGEGENYKGFWVCVVSILIQFDLRSIATKI